MNFKYDEVGSLSKGEVAFLKKKMKGKEYSEEWILNALKEYKPKKEEIKNAVS